jgi:F0F1-type ATP synthase assembly protein I
MAKPKGPSLLLVGVGTILASTVVAGFFLGYLTDYWLDTQPIFMLAFGLLGLVGGILRVYKLLTNPDLN